jgi:hypothetical protein
MNKPCETEAAYFGNTVFDWIVLMNVTYPEFTEFLPTKIQTRMDFIGLFCEDWVLILTPPLSTRFCKISYNIMDKLIQ